MRSLFAGVSGLRNHQVRLDVIGNNISNVNTVAFKSSRVTFKEAFAQMVQGASRPAGEASAVGGGTNPIQVGLGMNIGSVDLLFTQGNLENTGVTTDLAIQGDAFFVASDGRKDYYTRSGNFQLDADGRLVASTNGYVVQGRQAQDGVLTDTIGDIVLPFGQKSAARATTEVSIGGNLDAEAVSGSDSARETTMIVYDSMGSEHELSVAFQREDSANDVTLPDGSTGQVWSYSVTLDGNAVDTGDSGFAIFDSDGRLFHTEADVAAGDLQGIIDGGGFTATAEQGVTYGDMSMTLDFGEPDALSGLSQFAGPSTAVAREQDGYTMGQLERIGISQTGKITGAFTNGVNLTLGQLVLADFNNPAGLIRSGDNMYSTSANSGAAVLGFAGEGSQSVVTSGALEMSNVDLAQEFTSMITAQRGFQSNARVITASDEMLQELVNLKR
jgi:flagellar hook protein FlgE